MPKKNTETQPWERQDGESSPAYEAFSLYRDMPSKGQKRSIRAVARALGKSDTIIGRWSSAKNWVARAAAYDNFLTREERRQYIDDLKRMNQRQAKIAMQLQNAALEALARTKPENLAPKDIVSFIRIATQIESDARKELLHEAEPESNRKQDGSLADEIQEAWAKRRGAEYD